MSNVFKVSQSKVKTYRRCHQAYHYRYKENLRKKGKSRPLQFGTMIHEMLERYINGDDPFEYLTELEADVGQMKLFKAQREEYGDIIEDTRDIITDYMEYWKEHDAKISYFRKNRRSAEHSFEIELFPDVVWTGKIDFIAIEGRLRWLGEHKTYTRKPNDDDRWRNLQSVTYFRANDILGWKRLDGCMWDYIKSKPPAIPSTLKDGSLSTKKIDTLPAAVNRLGWPVPEGLRVMAEKNRSEYFHRVFTPVNRSVADLVFEDFETTVREMVENQEKSPSRNIDKHCSWCDYEPLCRATLQGLDADYVREREYTDGTKDDTQESVIHRGVAPECHHLDQENRKAAREKGR